VVRAIDWRTVAVDQSEVTLGAYVDGFGTPGPSVVFK
jgi:hypothetical protein